MYEPHREIIIKAHVLEAILSSAGMGNVAIARIRELLEAAALESGHPELRNLAGALLSDVELVAHSLQEILNSAHI